MLKTLGCVLWLASMLPSGSTDNQLSSDQLDDPVIYRLLIENKSKDKKINTKLTYHVASYLGRRNVTSLLSPAAQRTRPVGK